MSTHAFSFEVVYHWPDRWLPLHRATADPAFLAKLPTDTPNPAGAALVAELRERTLDLYDELGVASNQLGRTYRYYDNLAPGDAGAAGCAEGRAGSGRSDEPRRAGAAGAALIHRDFGGSDQRRISKAPGSSRFARSAASFASASIPSQPYVSAR